MNRPAKLTEAAKAGIVGAALSVGAGGALWTFPLGDGLVRRSYDVPFAFTRAGANVADVCLILQDDLTYHELQQDFDKRLDRAWHAQLLDKLRVDQPRLVVFDVIFNDPGDPRTNLALARAMTNLGRVVLAASVEVSPLPGGKIENPVLPEAIFLQAVGANWGYSKVEMDGDDIVRRHYVGSTEQPSLSWQAATLANAPVTVHPANRTNVTRWIRYYGPPGAFEEVSFALALQRADGYFSNKFVFIGGKPGTLNRGDIADTFRTPFTLWENVRSPGVEIQATMFLNLLHNEWLERLAPAPELGVIVLAGLLFGFGLARVRPVPAAGAALLGMLAVALGAVMLVWTAGVWFSWLIVVAAQIPSAWLCSTLAYTRRLTRAPAPAPRQAPVTGAATVVEAGDTERIPVVPDHELLRVIGKGAYGEVWLARNRIGIFRAVKLVYRARFEKATPFEREYRGMQRFMPVSMDHPGFLRIFHVGRDDQEGHFYYIMEIGDDELRGQAFDPQTYSPKNLAKELKKVSRLAVGDCLRIFIPLSDALDHLHRRNLVHRDIKPSNIIFVNDLPKLADIGLVAQLQSGPGLTSFVGTAGFIPPEGPGTAAADIFSLGCVLFEAALGDLPEEFSDKPTAVDAGEAPAGLRELSAIIQKASAREARLRYQSAADLRAALVELQARLQQARRA